MKSIELLKQRIQDFAYQQRELELERDEKLEDILHIYAKIKEYQEDINDMQLTIEKLERKE